MRKKIRVTPKKEKIVPAGSQTTSFPIVGIGASAGGLEAYQELLRNLSAKPGMAFVFIMHLAPGRKSLLAELLARLTKMPVREIKSGMPIEVNHVYIKPPDTNLSIASGKLILSKRNDINLKHMPIDYFFRSLADELGNRAIGVILSGTATDGTLGAEAIKAEGGITFAQDEKSAKYDGMPQSAIAAGCVDFVLSPKKIASELERIAKHPLISSAWSVKTDKSIITEDKGLESIFDILRSATGLDFTHYKTPTISRRIARRMVLLKLENLRGYIKFLRENKDEAGKLYEDLLINVTSFFRDPKVFDALKKQVLPAILKNRTKGQGVRIWVPGCSSGEEAYSIAICFLESLGNKASAVPVQIFSTDVREDSINEARRGIYGKNIKNSITPQQLKRFFTKTGDSYKVSKQLREMCIFSKQNVFSDPPFSNLDLISCRNLFIYLKPVLQKKLFHNFHYGLRPGGFLLLGNSETAGGYSNLFKTLDGKHRIFAKKYLSVEPELESGRKYYPSKKLEIKGKPAIEKGKETIESIAERIVLDKYTPCGVLIDNSMKVVQFRGHTGRYLESASGKPSLDIFKLAREELLMPLRAAIYKARETKHTVKRETEDFQHNGHGMRVNITVVPVKYGPLKEEFFLVLFDEIAGAVGLKKLPKARGKISLKAKSAKSDEYIDNLQKELAETKEYLQTVIEEQDSANEEVKTANEEILSSNEELQSTNEELETAKEELQSSNEELVTTNEELQKRNTESYLLNNDLVNLLDSINMPVVMMGKDLVIRRVTPQAEKALNVISSDVGRPISKIKLNVDIPDFEKMLLDVIKSHHPTTFEIKDREENWYSAYIRPYRTLDNKIDGVVAIFVDITERKKVQQIIVEAREYAENIIETMQSPLIVLDTDLKVISANHSFYQTFKVTHKDTEGRFIYDLGNRQWDIPKLRQLLSEVTLENKAIDNYEIEHNFETIGPKTMLFNVRRLAAMQMILITIGDITKRKMAEEELRKSEERFRLAYSTVSDLVWELDLPTGQLGWFGDIDRLSGYAPGEFPRNKKAWENLIVPEDRDRVMGALDRHISTGEKYDEEYRIRAKDGSIRYWLARGVAVRDTQGKAVRMLGACTDITERKKIEIELKEANEELIKFNDLKDEFVSIASHELRTPLSIISGAVKLLIDEIPGKIVPEQKEILDMAMNNLNRLARIVDALLNISKIESGKIELYRTDADICRLIAETVNEYSQQAEKKHINLSCQLPPHPVILYADADRIKEVIANLLSNSIKFTPEDGSINVCCEDHNDDVFIFVKDTGCGVAKNNVPRMFEKFTQFDRKVGPGEKGTGLGLAICKGLVNLHSGKIWAESDAGSGMKISFTIPRLSAEHIFTESVDNAVKSSLKTGGGAAVVLISTKPVIQIDSTQMQVVLKDISGVLERNLRRNALNTVVQGTNEVLVVLGNCDITGAASVCQRLTQAIEGHLADKDLSSKLDLLIGYAAYPDDGQTGQSLIEKAREAVVACLPLNKA
ncbi:MAG: chemotaxis protein CheB [Sedimentisphaerales bacterium]